MSTLQTAVLHLHTHVYLQLYVKHSVLISKYIKVYQ